MDAAAPASPPPTPHPDDDGGKAADLTLLLRLVRLPEAVAFLRAADSEQLRAEVALACAALPTAPSTLLRCVDLYVASASNTSRLPLLLEPIAQCVTPAHQAQLSPADQALAAALLPRVVSECRVSLAAAFARAFRVDGERVVAFVSAELLQTDVFAAVQLLDSLQLKRAISTAAVVQQALLQKDIRAADLFVKGASREDRVLYVQRLVACNISDKIVKKRIALFKLDPSEFPEYLKRKQYGALRFLIHSGQFDDALSFVEQEESLKKYACQMLIRKRGANDASTRQFVYRAGLAAQLPQVDVSGQDALSFQLDGAREGDDDASSSSAYLSLDAMIGESNLHFVDTPEQLRECVDHLRDQSVIGFDSEWKTVHADATTGRTRSFCAVLQLASREKAFVVDMLQLGSHGAMLQPVLVSDKVLVLGFDTRGDLGAMRLLLIPDGNGNRGGSVIIARLLDIQAVARKLLTQGISAKGDDTINENEKRDAAAVPASEAATADGSQEPKTSGQVGGGDANSTARRGKKKKKKRGASSSATSLALTNIADLYLGKPLDKRLRMSDWAKRPLSPAQMRYAALDALVLVRILDKMRETQPADALDAILRRCTQKNVK